MNLNPEIWGPHAWFFLDSVVLGMPDHLDKNEIEIYKDFFYSLQYFLPCKKCRVHYHQNLDKYPLTDDIVESKEKMLEWIIELHNSVRLSNNQNTRTLEEIIEFYKKEYSNEKKKKSDETINIKINTVDYSKYILIIIIIVLIIYIYTNKYYKDII